MTRNPEATSSLDLRIHGLDCAEEVAVLKHAVGPLVGGEARLAFDILNARMIVHGRVDAALEAKLMAAIRAAGMRPERWRQSQPAHVRPGWWRRHRRNLVTGASGLAAATGFLLHVISAGGIVPALGSEGSGRAYEVPASARFAYTLAIIAGGAFVARKAWFAVRRGRPDMNLLMTMAVIGAVGIGEWFEAATVSFLFALSLALEAWSVGRARHAIEALMDLAVPLARVLRGGTYEEIELERVPVGSRVLVKPGERIPLDGIVIAGTSMADEAPITGESIPADKEPGSQVFAGTINGDGALEIETTRPSVDTTLARIIRMVGEASRRRAAAEQWVDRFARVYTPSILLAAALLLVIPPAAFGQSWSEWAYRSLVLLVIGCPCALVISTPVSIVASLTSAARNGVLVKGGTFIEAPARLRAVAFDKTGTLTLGRPAVQQVIPLHGHTETEILATVGGIESRSEHLLARAIVDYVQRRGVVPRPVSDFHAMPGKGATARIDGRIHWIGSHRYLEERGQETPEIHARLEQLADAGHSVVVVGNERHVCGLLAVGDAVRPGARAAIQALRAEGVHHIVMLTGDNEATARAIAAQTGIDEVRAELLPEEKVAVIDELVGRYSYVGMVGDGINDAPAMARATLGLAMGADGSDVAIETADVALMSDDLSRLPWLMRLSRRTTRIVRQNIVLSLSVKALFVILAFLGSASLWSAIAADMGVSLLVIFNALRLLGDGAHRSFPNGTSGTGRG